MVVIKKQIFFWIAGWCCVILLIDFSLASFMIKDNLQSFRTAHHFYHHDLLPNQKAPAAWGPMVYPFFTNSLGFRDSAVYDVEKVFSGQRFLFMGDSHTEAVGVPYEYSFAGILSKEFSTKGISILNGAVVSYSPKIHFLKAKYLFEVEKLKIDKVFLFIDMSDLQNEIAYEKFNPASNASFASIKQKITTFMHRNSFIYYSISKIAQSKKQKDFFEKAKLFDSYRQNKVRTNTEELYASFFSNFDDKQLLSNPAFHGVGEWIYNEDFRKLADKGLQLGQNNVAQLDSLCKINGVELIVSVHPWQSQVEKGDTTNYYVASWSAFCQKREIGFINLYPVFINSENPYIVMRDYYIKEDNHWNERGHAAVAKYLKERILK